ncbi:MAG: hypothetical protein JWQ38_2410 [Flavipsychrobacter sp.]|nr:hypothetical protein [Flavipsychrobacter sp.]
MKKLGLIIGAALMLARPAIAQDVHFTQYFTSPLTLNPALTGLVSEDLRFAANYRSQWASASAQSSNAYTTATFSFDFAALKGVLPESDALGIGLLGLQDKAGTGAFTNTTVGVSLAYHKGFGRDRQSHLSIGMQTYMVQKTIDFSKLTTEDMIDPNTGQPFPNAINPLAGGKSVGYPDFNAGIMYSGKVADKATAYIGYSYYHLTQPVETFFANTSKVHARQSVYLGGSFDMSDKAVLYASALYQGQASAFEVMLGSAIGFVLNAGHDMEYQRNTIFYMGGWYRYGDAISPYVAIEWSKMRIGLSYDVNESRFRPATKGLGGFEMSLLFFGKVNKHEKNQTYDWSCPKFN